MRKPTFLAMFAVAALFACQSFAADTQTIRDRLGRPVAKVTTCVGGTCKQVTDRLGRTVGKVVQTGKSVVFYDRLGRRR